MGGGGTGGGGGGGGLGGFAGTPQVDPALAKQWAREVTLGTEYGGGAQLVARWTQSPTLSVMEGSAADRAHLDELVPELGALIAPLSIQVVADGDASANIEVYFTQLASFDAIAQQKGFSVAPGNWGYFWMFWAPDRSLTKSIVLLATDVLDDDQLRHYTFEETTQSLGLATDSAIFSDSIFYAQGSDGGDATELGALDQRLVRFVYTYLAPSDGVAELDAAFDTHFFE